MSSRLPPRVLLAHISRMRAMFCIAYGRARWGDINARIRFVCWLDMNSRGGRVRGDCQAIFEKWADKWSVFRRLFRLSQAAMADSVDCSSYAASNSTGATLPIDSSNRRLLDQSTHPNVANSTASRSSKSNKRPFRQAHRVSPGRQAGAVFLAGALGLEIVGGLYYEALGSEYDLRRRGISGRPTGDGGDRDFHPCIDVSPMHGIPGNAVAHYRAFSRRPPGTRRKSRN